jgi:hypothetical protein
MNGKCPNCDENIFIPNNVRLFDSLRCSICGEPLKVTSVKPLEIDYDLSEYEDEEYEFEEDY